MTNLKQYIPEPPKGSMGHVTALLFGVGVAITLIGVIDATLRLLHIPKDVAFYLAILIVFLIVSVTFRRSLRSEKGPESPQPSDDGIDRREL